MSKNKLSAGHVPQNDVGIVARNNTSRVTYSIAEDQISVFQKRNLMSFSQNALKSASQSIKTSKEILTLIILSSS